MSHSDNPYQSVPIRTNLLKQHPGPQTAYLWNDPGPIPTYSGINPS